MEAIRQRVKRALSMHDKNPDLDNADDLDEETTGHLHREIERAEAKEDEPYGKPGSFLNKLIMHGNKKTEDEFLREQAQRDATAADAAAAQGKATVA